MELHTQTSSSNPDPVCEFIDVINKTAIQYCSSQSHSLNDPTDVASAIFGLSQCVEAEDDSMLLRYAANWFEELSDPDYDACDLSAREEKCLESLTERIKEISVRIGEEPGRSSGNDTDLAETSENDFEEGVLMGLFNRLCHLLSQHTFNFADNETKDFEDKQMVTDNRQMNKVF